MRTLFEALGVAVVGVGLALLANYLSPRGLSLGRDYFPEVPLIATGAPRSAVGGGGAASTVVDAQAPASGVQARLAARGFRFIEAEEVRRLFDDPRREQELVVFIDARSERHYQEGHVPGAYLFDRYYPEQHFPEVMPVCQQAEVIVVYCLGGDCEDSEFAAVALKDVGIPAERLCVYGGGIAEWQARGWLVEVGPRGSGVVRGGTP